ncbi:MAG: hypothetical protein CMK74_21450 [Pseudomonadales bacterium]|nr:hypothetical protein [Pseudomonadales bacterium]
MLIGYSCCPLTRAAFEKHGHDVWTCDLLPARDFSRKHHQCDVWEVMGNKWDLAILHPMCTYLTVSAAWAYADPDYDKYPGVGYHQRVKPGTLVGEDRRAARDIELENFRALLDLPFPVAIENPAVSFINKAIRGPDQVIHPHQFGDDASKATGLWLTRGLPKLALDPAKQVAPRMVNGRPRWANQTDSGQNRLSPSDDRWLERSKTYPGIAAAMGDQWGAIL